ncbi:similar to Saccharomyces cerevisiae YDL080C THI3 Probable alpha-ketoisocaproate decarboxylase, may have a role in catabolism of amino acids to long-chain and complex alcohols [Maudiozyma barnettii]|uniref:Similar to Saccharomyces cerevisiae YDL080C THI3 Probable alpha-ketoisocaproate decarboxylase, may have a role in catabolism of amino acids to long-chain and complex alcohols n=1 Tax=Maudiozyma barnettii TaxID=61262 RepID=A0A8H2VKM2_9SACH|nr:branched-chain-2-oxoacid decarboxylase THI3 [Kazachstania barnettii]CAB4257098.1 similar to Saccharomyces cerevisiae YDL080C THI3 Probable alpha-ketoisocaproate decarboxylase, may have a role in catabolism of amino acids to long-chain and complex alcohols [Kazachstania barnettii]CAD1779468.1 similar to Saccharomyces cerevisiae YDL080C THI3 Probable alpha-ketoisocaproate decarboxylase, may have a role in catabolism of amino acids to long-chain and complex alcohols [Kazachstania barnettii]
MSSYSQINNLPPQISVGEYIFHRLRQLKVTTIFGLPGEFSMPLMDKLYRVPDMRWAGNTNELNAAYAVDGYSRLKRLGCIITTFGVGELSAMNGIAGSFAEHVGLLHIVGMPQTSATTKQLLLHHTLGNGDYEIFYRMANDITCYTTIIIDSDFCADEVDMCIRMAWVKQKPTYMGVPSNQIDLQVDSARLDIDLDLRLDSLINTSPIDGIDNKRTQSNGSFGQTDSQRIQDDITKTILKRIYESKNPAIVVDACVARQGLLRETQLFCELTKFPTFVTPMAKGIINEDMQNFGGVFTGSISSPDVREIVDFADFVIVIGCVLEEFSTSSFHFNIKSKNRLFIFDDSVKIKNVAYPEINIKNLLKNVLFELDQSKINYTFHKNLEIQVPRHELTRDQLLRQEWVWGEFSHWFRPGDIIITEVGTSAFGIIQTKFPKNTWGISQALWGSSGYSLGACLGASFAAQELEQEAAIYGNTSSGELSHRVILFVGDGAFQITMQELSTIIKANLKPYIFIMNNQGYSIDRFLHHRANAKYYDIQQWHYLSLLSVFGATDYETRKIITMGDLQDMLADQNFAINDKIRMLEVMVPSMDVPQAIIDKWQREKEGSNVINENDRPHSIETSNSDILSWSESPLTELEPERKKRHL